MNLRHHLRLFVILALVVPALVLTACGKDNSEDSSDAPEQTSETTQPDVDISVPEQPEIPVAANPIQAAGIDPATGSTTGLVPDVRPGTESPSAFPPALGAAARLAKCEVRLGLRDEGNNHLLPGDPRPVYRTVPPTSGDHDPVPVADGAYRAPPPPTGVVHALEHGRVVIQYSPSLSAAEQLLLKGFFDEDPNGMLLVPNAKMPYDVAATAWRNLIGCDSFEAWPKLKSALTAFRDQFRGRGPERIPL